MNAAWKFAETLSRVDWRSLVAFRVTLGLVIACDALLRATECAKFYSDSGWLPRALLLSSGSLLEKSGPSLHMVSGSAVWSFALLAALAVSSLSYSAGIRPRLSGVVSWVLLISVHHRNPMVLSLGDALLGLLLLWSLLLPLGKMGASPGTISGVAPLGLKVQIVAMYLTNAWLKLGGQWENGTALQVALSADHMVTPFGRWLLTFPEELVPMTHAVLWVEVVMPVLALFVVRPWWMKALAVCVLVSLHAGIAMSLEIGIFPWVNMVALLVFVPSEAWEALSRLVPASVAKQIRRWALSTVAGPRPPRCEERLCSLMASLLLVMVTILNASTLRIMASPPIPAADLVPGWLRSSLVKGMRIDQRWMMYAPSPSDFDGWFVFVGTLSDGRKVDIARRTPLSWEKPSLVAAEFSGFRERKFVMKSISSPARKGLLYRVSADLAAKWNSDPPEGEQGGTVVSVDAYFVVERTKPPSVSTPGAHHKRERRLMSSWSAGG